MKYPIAKEFGVYAHLRAPVYRAFLPLINLVLTRLPKRKTAGLATRALAIPGEGGSVAALLLEPDGLAGNAPCLVYCHGGGFAMEAAPSHYALAASYALGASCRVLFVQYRLAPKHPFPAPPKDCLTAYRWALEHADALCIDPARVAVGGDSAGGCLAAAVCLMARDGGMPLPRFQILIYPVLDRRMGTASMRRFFDTPMWNARCNRRMWRWYLPEAPAGCAAYASPAEAASLCGLPDAYVETAEFDCLHDEGALYAASLSDAGCAVEQNDVRGAMHGFDTAQGSPIVRGCIARRVAALRRAFGE